MNKYRAVVFVPMYAYVEGESVQDAKTSLTMKLLMTPNSTIFPYQIHSVMEASEANEKPPERLKGV